MGPLNKSTSAFNCPFDNGFSFITQIQVTLQKARAKRSMFNGRFLAKRHIQCYPRSCVTINSIRPLYYRGLHCFINNGLAPYKETVGHFATVGGPSC